MFFFVKSYIPSTCRKAVTEIDVLMTLSSKHRDAFIQPIIDCALAVIDKQKYQ